MASDHLQCKSPYNLNLAMPRRPQDMRQQQVNCSLGMLIYVVRNVNHNSQLHNKHVASIKTGHEL